MAYVSGFDEDPVKELKFLVNVIGGDRDEVDSLSRQVINLEAGAPLPRYVVHKSFFPQREIPLEYNGVKVVAKRLRKVSEKTLQKFRSQIGNLQSKVLSLLTLEHPLDDAGLAKLPSLLKSVCHSGDFRVLIHKQSQIILLINSEAIYNAVGDEIVRKRGLLGDIRVICLEALCADRVPNYFLEISTPRSSGLEIQQQLSAALVTFCGEFKSLRLHEGGNQGTLSPVPDERSALPSVALTLMFSRAAQANAGALQDILTNKDSVWITCRYPDVVQAPDEQLFALKTHSGPLFGLKSACPFPGIRISVTFSQNLEEMEKFYNIVTGVSPAPRDDSVTGTSYRIYPVARNFELQLVYNAGAQTSSINNLWICVRIADHQKISHDLSQPLTHLDAGHWETFDPVGNRVILFTAFE